VVLRDVGATLFWVGCYDDVVAKVNGEWLFKQRICQKWEGEVLSNYATGSILMGEPPDFNAPVESYSDSQRPRPLPAGPNRW